MTKNKQSSLVHFKIHRLKDYVGFYIHYVFCKIFHEQESEWQSWKGALVCNYGYTCDLGYSYGTHCEQELKLRSKLVAVKNLHLRNLFFMN